MSNTNITHLANEFILGKTIQDYPLKIETLHELAERLGFCIYTYSEATEFIAKYDLGEYTRFSAFTFIERSGGESIKAIFYRNSLAYGEKVFCILHEIGHIYLSHTYYGVLGKSPDEITMSRQEEEADIFAYQVAAPICLLKAMDICEIDEICAKTLLESNRAEHVFFLLTQYKENDELERQIVQKYAMHSLKNPQRESPRNAELEEKIVRRFQRVRIKAIVRQVLTIACFVAAAGILTFIFVDANKESRIASEPAGISSEQQDVSDTPPEEPSSSETPPADGKAAEMVYISVNGSKYHFKGCQYINGNMVEVTFGEAVRQGYEPCKRCGKEG